MEHVQAKTPTCTEDGNIEYWYCKREGKYFSDAEGKSEITNVVVSKLGHDMTHVEAKTATCTEDGNVEYWHCNRDGKNYLDSLGKTEITNVVVSKLGHDMEHVEAKAPTSKEAGNIEYWYCKRDGKYYLDAEGKTEATTIIIPKLGRSIVRVEAKAPTCDEDGNIEYWYCQEENKYYSDSLGQTEITNIVVPKLGHNYKLVASWNSDGSCNYYLECENDSNHKVTNIDGTITHTTDTATCEAEGEITYTLSFTYDGKAYSDSYTVTTPAKGHSLTLVEGLNPTAYAAGYKKYYSCECGKYFEDSEAKNEILDLAVWKAEGGKGYLAPLGFSATYVFADKAFVATLEGAKDAYFEASKDAFDFEDERGVQFLQKAGAIKVTSLYKYNNIRKIVVVASTASSANGDFTITVLDKTVKESINKAKQKNVELEYVFDEEVSGGFELLVTPNGGSCYIKSIQIYCESIGQKIHKHNYTYDVVWKGYEAYLVATCNDCAETEEGHIVETKLELDVEEQLPNCENDGLRTYKAKLPAGVENNNYVLEKEEVLEKLGHDYDIDNAKWAWADDLSSATFTVSCSRCGDKTLNATVSHETTKKATEEENGIETYTAKVVFEGVEYTNVINKPILFHIHEFEVVGFEWNEYKTKAYAILKCTYGKGTEDQCPKEEKIEVPVVLNEELSYKPTCEAAGKDVYDVSYENSSATLEIEIEALGHSYGDLIAEVPATCEKTGVKAHYECERCHELFIKDENDSYVKVSQEDLVIAKLPHGSKVDVDFEFVADDFKGQGKSTNGGGNVSVTKNGITISTDKGYGTEQFRAYGSGNLTISVNGSLIRKIEFTYSSKSYTGGLETKYEDINSSIWTISPSSQARFTKITVTLADQYVLTHVEAKPATCEAEGNIEYWYCEACGAKFADALGEKEISDVVIAKLPHNYDFDNIDWKWADDYSSVKVTISCLDCDHEAEFTLTSEVSANGQIVEVNGVFTATFTFDNNNYTNEIDTNHVHKYQFKEWVWADDNLTATIKFECEDESCKDIYSETIDSTFEVTVEPKCETKGTKKFSVAFEYNGVEYKDSKEVELEALGHDYKIYDEVAPKAEEAGTKEHVKCERCGDIYLSYNQKETVIAAFELTGNNKLTNKTVIGEITKIETAYNKQYKNISVFIKPLGFDETKAMECYRMTGGENLKVGDLIKVNGTIINHIKNNNSIIEFDQGCTFEMLTKVDSSDLVISPIGYEIIYKNQGNLDFDGTHEANYPQRHLVDEEVTLLSATKDHYTFVGWYDNEECNGDAITSISKDIHSDVTLYAKWEIDTFSVTWKNADGTVLELDENVAYGTMPSYDGEEPTKASTKQYSYSFNNWNNELALVTEDVEYIATYTETIRKYNITISANNNEYGSVNETSFIALDYGTSILVSGNEIVIGETTVVATETADTVQYDYSFVGFENFADEEYLLEEDLEIVANFERELQKYKVEFVFANGVVAIEDKEVYYGQSITFSVILKDGFEKDSTFSVSANTTELTPTEENGNEYTIVVTEYVIVMVDGVKLQGYKITYLDENGKKFSGTHEAGYPEAHIHGVTTELKSATKDHYTFVGWYDNEECTGDKITSISKDIHSDITLYAKWTINKYTITFVSNNNEYGTFDVDKLEVVYDTELLADANEIYDMSTIDVIVIAKATPTTSTAQYTYTFIGFEGVVERVSEDITITAKFERTTNAYNVTWKNYDDTVLETDENVEYGATPSYDGETPTKASTAQYTYQFSGWTPEVSTVTGAVEYVATFTETLRTYTVKWKNGNDVLEEDADVEYGTMPSYDGEQPTKASTAQYTYQFSGWAPTVSIVTGAVEYEAQFDGTAILYSITIVNNKSVLNETLGSTVADVSEQMAELKVTLTFTPENNPDGFINKVSEVTINGGSNLAANIDKDNKLEFDMPEENVTVNVIWAEYKGEEVSASVKFGSANGSISVGATGSTVKDSKNNDVELKYTGTSYKENNADYGVIGSKNNPATSITITITLPSSLTVKSLRGVFGGNNSTAGDISFKVDEEVVGSGSLNGNNDVTVTNTKIAKGSVITIAITKIDRGVKLYDLSYTYGDTDLVTYPTVSFNTLDGTSINPIQLKEGKTVSKPTKPTKNGYIFDGWYLSDDEGQTLSQDEFDFTTQITDDLVLFAKWIDESAGKYTVISNYNYVGAPDSVVEEVVVKKTATAQAACSRNGYTFLGWYEGDVNGTSISESQYVFDDSKTAQANDVIYLYAKWKANNYTVTLNANYTGGNSIDLTVTFDLNVTSVFTAPTRVGYTLDGYYLEQTEQTTKLVNADGTLVASVDGYTNSNANWINYSVENLTLYAKWTAKTYNLVLDANYENGVDKNITITFDSSTLSTYEVHEREGFTFVGYYLEETEQTTKLINADGTLVASVDGYTDSDSNWIKNLTEDLRLYAKWKDASVTETVTTTYTFTSKSWGDATNSWTSGKDGNELTSNRGVKIQADKDGANAKTNVSFTNVSKVVVTYSTNASKGTGSIDIKIGDNTAISQNVTKTGGTTDRTLEYTVSPSQSGAITITVNCSQNSIYIKSISITYIE